FAALRAWALQQRVHVVLPQRERSCVLCNAEREQWEALGMTLGCGPEAMLVGAFNKARTLELAEACGLRIPPTRFPQSLADCHTAAEAVGYPCILKPRFSDFWDGERFLADHGARYVQNADDLEAGVRACRQGEFWPVIQGIVSGRGKGVFALCDRGEPVAWFAHERIRDVRPSGSGSSLRRSTALDPRLQAAAARLLSALAWHGPAMVEFRDDGAAEPCLIEVNGRFWGSLELAVASGVDFPKLWVDLLRGAPIEPPTRYETGVTLRWLWGDVKRLLYVAAGPPPGCPEPYPSILQGLREVLVLDDQSDDRTRAILDDYVSRQPIIRVLDNPRRIQPVALNIGIRASRGEILLRMDAHVVYPPNYISELVAALERTGADSVGGVLITVPGNQTLIGRAIAIAMSHPFGVGNAYFRIGVRQPRWVDTIAFFCCRRETFERVGLFDEQLARDEDSEFNARLIKRGGRILLSPNVVSHYFARDSLSQVARMYYQYGYSKPLVARKVGAVMTARQLVPPAFVLLLAATAALSPWVGLAGLLLGATAA